jgi:signal transduction histidine kinase
MKSAMRRNQEPLVAFEREYESCLDKYMSGEGELALGQAYELGRRALAEGKSLVEMTSVHHQAVIALIQDEHRQVRQGELLRASADFLAECLSPYEMAHRGFQDAVKSLRQLNETLEEEIKRIAYAVHDEAGQLLVAVHLALAEVAAELPASHQAKFTRMKELLTEVEKQLRRYSHELRPTILDDLGWVPAIRFLADGVSKRANLAIHIDAAVSERLPSRVETVLYRIVQEALTNAVKHAKASTVWIRSWKESFVIYCSIRDDGAGFTSPQSQISSPRKGLGLIAMRERLSAVGGTLQIESSPGNGTKLSVHIPLEDEHANSNRARG